MNRVILIGNLTKDPELRTTQGGLSVCTFSMAVNRRKTQDNQPEADFFRVTAWRGLGENCAKYLAKGRKVCVIGPVSVSTYKAQDGSTRASLEVTADDVEFLFPKGEGEAADLHQAQQTRANAQRADADAQREARYQAEERDAIKREARGEYTYVPVDGDDELPFD